MRLKTYKISDLKKEARPITYLSELRAIAARVTDTEMTFNLDSTPWKTLQARYLYYDPTTQTKRTENEVRNLKPRIMIVIGHYNRPAAVELNIAAIRHFCGPDIPILISDDGSDGCSSNPDPDTLYGQLCRLPQRYPNVWLWPNFQRIGHSGGDLGAFWKGLNWAGTGAWDGLNWRGNNGYDVLFKLSQRFVITQYQWAQHWALRLMQSNYATLGRSCTTHGFDLRTEAIGLKVGAWFRPDILAHLAPRRVGIAAEAVVFEVVRFKLDNQLMLWDLLSPGRAMKANGYLFRGANSEAEYDALSQQLGLPPGQVTTEDSNKMKNYIHG